MHYGHESMNMLVRKLPLIQGSTLKKDFTSLSMNHFKIIS